MDTPTAEKSHSAAKLGSSNLAFSRRLADLPGPKGIPLLGNAHQIKSVKFHLTLENWARESKSFLLSMLIICSPVLQAQDMRHIVGDDLKQFLVDKPFSIMRLQDNSRFRLEFQPDGTVYQNLEGSSAGRSAQTHFGKWHLNDNQIKVCIDWQDRQSNDSCYGFFQDGQSTKMYVGPQRSPKILGTVVP